MSYKESDKKWKKKVWLKERLKRERERQGLKEKLRKRESEKAYEGQ